MSSIARWTYVNVAKIRPFEGINLETQTPEYGEEYEILCDYIGSSEQARSNDGAEFITRHTIYTEDKRPKFLDLILLPGTDDWQEVRSHTEYPMGAFDEPDSPDFRMFT